MANGGLLGLFKRVSSTESEIKELLNSDDSVIEPGIKEIIENVLDFQNRFFFITQIRQFIKPFLKRRRCNFRNPHFSNSRIDMFLDDLFSVAHGQFLLSALIGIHKSTEVVFQQDFLCCGFFCRYAALPLK